MGRNTLKARLSRTGLWFCLPQLIGFLFVFLCPLALCVYYSMTAKSGGFFGACQLPGSLEFRHVPAGLGQYASLFRGGGRAAGGNLFSSFGGIPSPAFVFQPEDQMDAERPDYTDGHPIGSHHPFLSDFLGLRRHAQPVDGQ